MIRQYETNDKFHTALKIPGNDYIIINVKDSLGKSIKYSIPVFLVVRNIPLLMIKIKLKL